MHLHVFKTLIREWISPAAVTYWMNELVVENDNHPHLTEVIQPKGNQYMWAQGLWHLFNHIKSLDGGVVFFIEVMLEI